MKKIRELKYLLILFILIPGCASFEGIGDDLGEGLMNQLKGNADTIGFELMKGVRESFTNPESQKKLTALVDSLITHLGYNTNVQAQALRDSLLNEYVNIWVRSVIDDAIGDVTRRKLGRLRDEVLGDRTLIHLMNIRNELIGYRTRELLRSVVAQLRDELLSDTTNMRLAGMRNTLIGPETNMAISAIVDSAMVSLTRRYKSDLKPELQGDLTFLQKNVVWILIAIGVIVMVIIWFVWKRKEKYLRLTRLLTTQIYDIKEKDVKESLKESIKKNALQIGAEVDLREELTAQGILGK